MSDGSVQPLRLPKLPRRTVVKLAIALAPDLHERLIEYAQLYRETYGEEEPLTELVPYMLKSFIDADRRFAKRRAKSGEP